MSADQERSGESRLQQDSFQQQAPVLTLPKGGGAIRGIGEKLSANLVTGSASVSVPIATSPGRAGFGPTLSLTYDSGAGNGSFGLGWTLSLPAITRKTDRGLPRYADRDESDVFILFGSEDLVPEVGAEGERFEDTTSAPDYRIHRYRPRIEGAFGRIERWTHSENRDDVHWRVTSRDNVLSIYGQDASSRIADPQDPSRIFSWLLSETRDDRGNAVLYDYKPEDGAAVDLGQAHERNRGERTAPQRGANRYIKRIRYGNRTTLLAPEGHRPTVLTRELIDNTDWMFEVVFDYGEGHVGILPADAPGRESVTATLDERGVDWPVRADPFSSYRAGFEVRTYRLCRRVLMFHHFPDELGVADCLVRSTEFAYEETQAASFLTAVTQSGYLRQGDGYLKRSLPPVEYEYSRAIIGDEVREVDPASLDNLPQGADGAAYQWVDLDGEGLPGILTEQAGAWFYKRNESAATREPEGYRARFAPLETVARTPPGNPLTARGAQLLDLAGDGQLDVVELDRPVAGFYERTEDEDWSPFRAFASLPTLAWSDPNLRFVDLTGDGHADVLITEDNAFTWYPSLGEAGFGPAQRTAVPTDEERGPRLVLADGTQTIFLADCSGDGLTDLVRIRNGEICYWPNLGYGRFGSKITMDRAPHFDHDDQFDPRRIRLADIDGTGPIDLIYLGGREARCWLNQSGNAWSAAHALAAFPAMSNVASVATVDLLGNGTACLVWSSPLPGDKHRPMRYVALMAEGKPYLMVGVRNNLGAETRITYRPSTEFYLRDKQAGRPWITRLPFPVHCVETVTVSDSWRGTRFTTRYSYHHGHFDGVEREFRGFGRVEQIDVESFGPIAAGDPLSPYITDDRTLYQPPVKTVTWFHTGVFQDRERVLRQFEHEYFRTPAFEEHRLPEPDLGAQSLDADEWREALRACKGMTLRQEVYELDLDAWLERGEQRLVRLFTVATHNCWIERLQQRGADRHAVFLVGESEAITYHQELDLQSSDARPDPRIAHTLHLRFDDLGNPLQSVAAVYPRRGELADDSLSPADLQRIREVQTETHLAYTETRYTDDVVPAGDHHDYRLRVPCEVLTYELTGVVPAGSYFTLAELRGLRLSPVHQSAGTAVTPLPYHRLSGDGGPAKRLVENLRTLYFNQELSDPLPLGQLDARGLPFESYKLALTNDLLAAVFGDRLTDGIRRDLDDAQQSGYLSGTDLAARFPSEPTDPSESTDGEYWIRSGIAGFMDDAAAHFFLPERYTNAFGQTTTLEYDPLDLFVRRSTDPVGNTISIEAFDYRVLAPTALRDINGNHSRVAFDVLGLPVATAVMGKGNEADNLDGFDAERTDPDPERLRAFFTGDALDEALVRDWLGGATARHLYHFGETRATDGTTTWGTHPPCAATVLREWHVPAASTRGEPSPLQIAFEYSDGSGNVLVKKAQAEPETEDGPFRWIANGKTVLNNKGKPVLQYEPYFSDAGHRFDTTEAERGVGVTPILYYDAPGRLIRTELPDGSLSRVVFTPWQVRSYDANDTVLESAWYRRHGRDRFDPGLPLPNDLAGLPIASPEERAGWLAAQHAGTPAEIHLDSLGREVIGIAHNRVRDSGGELRDEKHLTFTKLDAEGKPLWIRDPRGNLVMQYISPPQPTMWSAETDEQIPVASVPCYDIAGNLLFQHSMDGGDRWMLMDATGQPFYAWDRNERANEEGILEMEDRVFHTTYDDLRRPLEQQLRVNGGEFLVVERFIYGESQPEPEARNLRGQVYQHFDPSGVITNQAFDFQGNLLEATRQLTQTYNEPVIDWNTETPLDERFTQRTRYDALGRMIRLENWHREARPDHPDQPAPPPPAVYTPQYNQRGVLAGETLTVQGQVTEAIHHIEYDAKGQRTRIDYGNGTTTRYDYDPQTFRLVQLRTTRSEGSRVYQDLHYTYDPVGNITEIRDDAYEPVFFRNQRVEPRSRYGYDALYRLIEAEGREQYSNSGAPPQKLPHAPEVTFPIDSPTDPNALRNYTQHYVYDAVGNILRMEHRAGDSGSWTRHYDYAPDSNRLLRTWLGSRELEAVRYDYDTHGSMLNLANTPDDYRLRWDYRDMIHTANLGGGGQAFYNYDSGKQRTRKRIERNGSRVEERLYPCYYP